MLHAVYGWGLGVAIIRDHGPWEQSRYIGQKTSFSYFKHMGNKPLQLYLFEEIRSLDVIIYKEFNYC